MAVADPDCESLFRTTQSWPGGFQGKLEFTLNENLDGWNIFLVFDGFHKDFLVNPKKSFSIINYIISILLILFPNIQYFFKQKMVTSFCALNKRSRGH